MANIDLNFKDLNFSQPSGSTNLNFGLSVEGKTAYLIITTAKPSFSASATSELDKDKSISVYIIKAKPELTILAELTVLEDNTNRASFASGFQAAQQIQLVKSENWQEGDGIKSTVSEPFERASAINNGGGKLIKHERSERINRSTRPEWESGAPLLSDRLISEFETAIAIPQTLINQSWQLAEMLTTIVDNRFEETVHLRNSFVHGWDDAIELDELFGLKSEQAELMGVYFRNRFEQAEPLGWGARIKPEPPTIAPYVPSTDLNFKCILSGVNLHKNYFLNFGVNLTCPWEGVYLPSKGVYIIMNELSLVRVSDGAELSPLNVNISTDDDSWCWEFSASIPPSQLHLVNPQTIGEPIELELIINDVKWRVMVESFAVGSQFNQSVVTIRGRSLTAFMSTNYYPNMSYSNSNATTARQIFDSVISDAFPLNEITGNWQLIDEFGWNVPAGGFSWSNSAPLYILSRLVSAVDGFLYSDPELPMITALAKHKLPSWEWGSTALDKTVNMDIIRTDRLQWENKPVYNGVYVEGDSKDGVAALVKRAGTAGNLLMPPLFDPLITSLATARHRGMTLLSMSGKQASVGIDMPFDRSLGLIRPRMLIGTQGYDQNWVGSSKSVSIRANLENRALVITQSIDLERHFWE